MGNRLTNGAVTLAMEVSVGVVQASEWAQSDTFGSGAAIGRIVLNVAPNMYIVHAMNALLYFTHRANFTCLHIILNVVSNISCIGLCECECALYGLYWKRHNRTIDYFTGFFNMRSFSFVRCVHPP